MGKNRNTPTRARKMINACIALFLVTSMFAGVFVFFVISMFSSWTSSADGYVSGYTTGYVNMRKKISLDDSSVIRQLDPGTRIKIRDEEAIHDSQDTGEDWIKISCDGKGYIAERFAKKFDFTKLGIDLSHFNKKAFPTSDELAKFLKDRAISYGMVRIGGRSTTSKNNIFLDEMLFIYLDGFEKAKVPFGLYWYYNPLSKKEAIEDAEYLGVMLRIIDDYKQFKIPVYLDIESNLVSKERYAEYACITIERLQEIRGEEGVGIYCNSSTYNAISEKIPDIPLWVAHYDEAYKWLPEKFYSEKADTKAAASDNLMIWQFTDKINLYTGLDFPLDLDYASDKFVEAYLAK